MKNRERKQKEKEKKEKRFSSSTVPTSFLAL